MFGRKKGPTHPTQPFTHADGCKILKADPGVSIPWSYCGDGLWKAECVCTTEYFREPITDNRLRLDPLDPKTSRHLPQWEYAHQTEPAVLKYLLKVNDRDGYWWVDCAACEGGWQVPFFAEANVG